MSFFAGTKYTLLDSFSLDAIPCPKCGGINTLFAATRAKYFHILGIPFLPLGKETLIKCSGCAQPVNTYDITGPMHGIIGQRQFIYKKSWPLWHVSGLIIPIFLLFGICTFNSVRFIDRINNAAPDPALASTQYNKDVSMLIVNPSMETDSVSFRIKTYLDRNVTDKLEKSNFRYFSRFREGKLLVLLQVDDLYKVGENARGEFIEMIEEILFTYTYSFDRDIYIGVLNQSGPELVSTPSYQDLNGNYANDAYLQEFYNDELESILKRSDMTE